MGQELGTPRVFLFHWLQYTYYTLSVLFLGFSSMFLIISNLQLSCALRKGINPTDIFIYLFFSDSIAVTLGIES